MTDRARFWAELLSAWEQSGLSQAEFCRRLKRHRVVPQFTGAGSAGVRPRLAGYACRDRTTDSRESDSRSAICRARGGRPGWACFEVASQRQVT